MAILDIIHYPGPVLMQMGDPIRIDEFGPDLKKLSMDMFETMEAAGGVGLAAPQIGLSKRIFVMDVAGKDETRQRHVLVNPQIVHVEGEQIGDEGCLSFPGLYQVVRREMRVIVRAQGADGEPFELDVEDLAARCILHETDHCDGIVFLDRMTALKRELAKRRIKRLQKNGEWK